MLHGTRLRGVGDTQLRKEGSYSSVDVIAHEPHPLVALNTAHGGLVGNPTLDRAAHAFDRLHLCFVAEDDRAVGASKQIWICLLYTSDAADE